MASAAPLASSSASARLSFVRTSSACGKRRAATRSRCPPAFTPSRSQELRGSSRWWASTTAPASATGRVNTPATARSGRAVTPPTARTKRPAARGAQRAAREAVAALGTVDELEALAEAAEDGRMVADGVAGAQPHDADLVAWPLAHQPLPCEPLRPLEVLAARRRHRARERE